MVLDRKRKRREHSALQKTQRTVTVFEKQKSDVTTVLGDEGFIDHGSGASENEDENDNRSTAGDIGADYGGPSTPTTGVSNKRPPTALELRDIKDAADLYRSSAFKLQIDALLPTVRPKYHHSAPLDHFLTALHAYLNSLSPVPPRHPLEAAKELSKKGVSVPYGLPLPTQETNWKVAFEKPSEIVLVGSWPNKLSVKGKDKQRYIVDLGVEIPQTLLQEKDYMNGRFFQKRAYFLSVIAAAIQDKKKGLPCEIFFSSPQGDPRLTSLILRPIIGSENDLTKLNADVRIIPILSPSSPIPIQRLAPSRANIRTTSEDLSPDDPSSIYNNTIHLCTTPKSHLLRSHTLKNLVPAYSDALTLLRVWANQRGYSRGSKLGIRGFESSGPLWAAVLELLINGEEPTSSTPGTSTKRKPVGKGLSSYQLFRAALDFLAGHNFSRDHIHVKSEKAPQFSPEEYPADMPVFVDASGVNVVASIPHGSLDMLRYDAKTTLVSLNVNLTTQDPFKEAFMMDHRDLQARFDIVLRVNLSSAKLHASSPQSVIDHGSLYNTLLATLISTLRQALNNRARAVVCLNLPCNDIPVVNTDLVHSPIIFIGLILDVEHAFRLVDHGPAADDPDPQAVQRFRDFWGNKAELRRFKDGSIVESVVWDVKTSDERTKIPYYIARHVLGHHCGIPQSDIEYWQEAFDIMLRLPESITSVYQTAKSETGFKAAMTAFDTLVKSIKALDDDLPLAVLNINPVSDMLRYTSVFTPTAVPSLAFSFLPQCAQYFQFMEVVIEFEKSGRWPDDLRAIQKVKLAILERLASKLMESISGLRAIVVVGHPVSTSDIMDTARLEIVTAQGWAFCAQIWHDREAMLLDTTIDDRPHIPAHIKRKFSGCPNSKNREAALEAKELYIRRFLHGPRHHRAIAALCHRHTVYAGTVRLTKRWLASHWILQKYLSPEAVELLCAAVFLGQSRNNPSLQQHLSSIPATKERGFAKVVELLKEWKWEDGIFVPLYGDEQHEADEIQKISPHLSTIGKDGVWRISTEFDPEGYIWTRDAPDAVMGRRIQKIALATWACLQNLESGNLDVTRIFSHPVQQYDFIIELNPAMLPRYFQNIHADPLVWAKKGKYANAAREEQPAIPPGYDPAQLLFNDLSRVYKDTFMLFHDPFGGEHFGGVWDPRLKDPRPFKILGKFSAIPTSMSVIKDKSMVTLNKEAILSEVERFGDGLITGITQRI